MGHDSSVVKMGNIDSSAKEIENRAGDPATFQAGLCVHLKSDDTLSLAVADGSKLGISVGRDLSDTKRTAICRKGLRVPIQVTSGFEPAVGAQVQISTTTGKAVTSGTAVNAVYAAVGLTGVDEDGSELADPVALIDFPGGL
jgi:hypothetical protein